MTLVILAAGMGSRYGGLKQLDPIASNGEYIIDFSIYDAIKAGFDKVVFVIKEENYDIFKQTIGSRVEPYIKTEYAFQSIDDLPCSFSKPEGRTKPWGTAQAVLAAEKYIADDETFAVINADDFYGADAYVKLASFLSSASTSSDGKDHFCMIGYILGNTLTENGTVSRGECTISEDGLLKDINERTKIRATDNGAEYLIDGVWTPISKDTIVSMNCWGFTASLFNYLKRGFANFLEDNSGDPLTKEYYLPYAVNEMMSKRLCDVKVYDTSAIWLGVTYIEDKENVKQKIRALQDSGEYPHMLWK